MYRVKFDADRDDKNPGQESMPVRLTKPYSDAYGFHFPLIQGTEVPLPLRKVIRIAPISRMPCMIHVMLITLPIRTVRAMLSVRRQITSCGWRTNAVRNISRSVPSMAVRHNLILP